MLNITVKTTVPTRVCSSTVISTSLSIVGCSGISTVKVYSGLFSKLMSFAIVRTPVKGAKANTPVSSPSITATVTVSPASSSSNTTVKISDPISACSETSTASFSMVGGSAISRTVMMINAVAVNGDECGGFQSCAVGCLHRILHPLHLSVDSQKRRQN
eukprot:TRINITY_DN1007_c0_g1_i4.p1 TRINITY_DN1007_c0_g1~~TRINITY_DN1007_c0_g1_i4.p1  ORF type:complete len:159 (-),score=9.53 TRINITY_DN1007_c0_g1_i4:641-1117(-)